MWKEECAKANREIQETVSELQTVKQLLDSATLMVKERKELLRHASYNIRGHSRKTMRHNVIRGVIAW
jgi:hypothetical protein